MLYHSSLPTDWIVIKQMYLLCIHKIHTDKYINTTRPFIKLSLLLMITLRTDVTMKRPSADDIS